MLGGDLISVVASNNRNHWSPPEFCYLYEINHALCDVRNAIKITFGIIGFHGSIRIKGRMTAQKTSVGTRIVTNYSYKTWSIELAIVWVDYFD